LPPLDPPPSARLPAVPETGSIKPVQGRIDAVPGAYVAGHGGARLPPLYLTIRSSPKLADGRRVRMHLESGSGLPAVV
jgi:hypothetical protein